MIERSPTTHEIFTKISVKIQSWMHIHLFPQPAVVQFGSHPTAEIGRVSDTALWVNWIIYAKALENYSHFGVLCIYPNLNWACWLTVRRLIQLEFDFHSDYRQERKTKSRLGKSFVSAYDYSYFHFGCIQHCISTWCPEDNLVDLLSVKKSSW